YFQLPRGYKSRLSRNAVYTQLLITLGGVVRLNFGNYALNPAHNSFERAFHRNRLQTIATGVTQCVCSFCTSNERLGRHAAGIQAVATHVMLDNQRHFGFYCSTKIGRQQTGGTTTNPQQVAIKRLRLMPARVNATATNKPNYDLCDQRKNAHQSK